MIWLALIAIVITFGALIWKVVADVSFVLATQHGCTCSRHWVDSRCPIHGWQSATTEVGTEGPAELAIGEGA